MTLEWISAVYNRVHANGSVYIATTVENLKPTLRALRESQFYEVNHIVWLASSGSAASEESHHHILFVAPDANVRTFNMEAVFSKSQRLPSGGSANYADREDVWGQETTPLSWADVVTKIIKYSSNRADKVSSFCTESQVVKSAAVALERQFVHL